MHVYTHCTIIIVVPSEQDMHWYNYLVRLYKPCIILYRACMVDVVLLCIYTIPFLVNIDLIMGISEAV